VSADAAAMLDGTRPARPTLPVTAELPAALTTATLPPTTQYKLQLTQLNAYRVNIQSDFFLNSQLFNCFSTILFHTNLVSCHYKSKGNKLVLSILDVE